MGMLKRSNITSNSGGNLNALVASEQVDEQYNSPALTWKNLLTKSRSFLIWIALVLFSGTLSRDAALRLLELPQKTFQVIRKGHVLHCGVIFLQKPADAGPHFAVRTFIARGRLIGRHCISPSLHDANLGHA